MQYPPFELLAVIIECQPRSPKTGARITSYRFHFSLKIAHKRFFRDKNRWKCRMKRSKFLPALGLFSSKNGVKAKNNLDNFTRLSEIFTEKAWKSVRNLSASDGFSRMSVSKNRYEFQR